MASGNEEFYLPAPTTGRSPYIKKHKVSISASRCILADRRNTSITQQLNHLTYCAGDDIAASPSFWFRRREITRISSLSKCGTEINGAEFLQLHHDGRIFDGMDR